MSFRTAFFALAILSACGGRVVPYTAQMADQPVSTAPTPVSTPSPRPLYVVISDAGVPSELNIQDTPHTIAGFDAFVAKSLEQALAPHFTSVRVVSSPSELPTEPHFVADFAVTSVRGKPVKVEGEDATALIMEWSIALRASGSKANLFTAAGEGVGEAQHQTLDETIKQTMKSALRMLRQIWKEKDVQGRLRAVEAPSSPAPETAESPGP